MNTEHIFIRWTGNSKMNVNVAVTVSAWYLIKKPIAKTFPILTLYDDHYFHLVCCDGPL